MIPNEKFTTTMLKIANMKYQSFTEFFCVIFWNKFNA